MSADNPYARQEIAELEAIWNLPVAPEESSASSAERLRIGQLALRAKDRLAEGIARVGLFAMGVLVYAVYDDERRYREQ